MKSSIVKFGYAATFAIAGIATIPDQAFANDRTFSIWGGYFGTDAPEVNGFSDGATAFPPINQVFRASPDDGFFLGLAFGGPTDEMFFGSNHIEWYFEGQQTNSDELAITPIGRPSIPIAFGSSAVALGTPPVAASLERERYEFGVSFSEFDTGDFWSGLTLTPFGGIAAEDAVSIISTVVTPATTNSDLDWWFAGLMIGGEHVTPLGTGTEVIFNASGGLYYHNSSVDILSIVPAVFTASDSDSGFGFRSKASIEFRRTLSETVQLSVFGGVDYWSETPFTLLPDPSISLLQPVGIDTGSTLDYKAGIKLTIKTGG